MRDYKMLCGDALVELRGLSEESVQCCVTSPPYWGLRDYGVKGQLGLEKTPEEYVARMVEVFREVRRVLRNDGTLWLNLGDSYAHNGACGGGSPVAKRDHDGVDQEPFRMTDRAKQKAMNYRVPPGLKPKDLVGIPWRVAFALQADGWYLRSEIIWHKPNPMPESVTDRPTKAHEQIFLMAKSERYYYDADAVAEAVSQSHGARSWRKIFDPAKQIKEAMMEMNGVKGGNDGSRNRTATTRNSRSVWTIATDPYPEAHFATFPRALIEPCIKAGCPPGGTVLDPFAGSGTTLQVATDLGCKAIGIELNPEYFELIKKRLQQETLAFA